MKEFIKFLNQKKEEKRMHFSSARPVSWLNGHIQGWDSGRQQGRDSGSTTCGRDGGMKFVAFCDQDRGIINVDYVGIWVQESTKY